MPCRARAPGRAGGATVHVAILTWGRHDVVQDDHVHDVKTGSGGCDGSPGGEGIGDDASASDNAFVGNLVDTIGPYPRECEYIHNIYPSGAGDLIQNNISFHSSGSGIRFNHNAKGATRAVPASTPTSRPALRPTTMTACHAPQGRAVDIGPYELRTTSPTS